MMDPEKRKLLRITIDDVQESKDYIERVMWDDTALKFELTKQFSLEDVL
jgi:DNA gyrase/topoisomerase IV subunit B